MADPALLTALQSPLSLLGDSPLAAGVADGAVLVDTDGSVVAVNPAAERLTGWTAASVVGRPFAAVWEPDEATDADPVARVLATGAPTERRRGRFTNAGGARIAVSYVVVPARAEDRLIGAAVVFRVLPATAAEVVPLPEIAGLDLASSFRPAGTGVPVGGDFYDVVDTSDGHLLVLGDVCGKGADAAAIGAMVRFLLRGGARATAVDLERLLRLVNDELLASGTNRFVTLVLVHVAAGTGRRDLRVASAGHPCPVLLGADGEATTIGSTGQLLGVVPDPEVDVRRVVLRGGDTLVLYTDGLTEPVERARRRFDVCAALDGQRRAGAAEVVTRLEDAAGLLDAPSLPDDVAVLAVRNAALPVVEGAGAPPGPTPADLREVGAVEAEFRRRNLRVVDGRPDRDAPVGLLCECGAPACRETLELSADTYDGLRRDPSLFAVLPRHVTAPAEDVVSARPGYWVVRKHGAAAAGARRSDALG